MIILILQLVMPGLLVTYPTITEILFNEVSIETDMKQVWLSYNFVDGMQFLLSFFLKFKKLLNAYIWQQLLEILGRLQKNESYKNIF